MNKPARLGGKVTHRSLGVGCSTEERRMTLDSLTGNPQRQCATRGRRGLWSHGNGLGQTCRSNRARIVGTEESRCLDQPATDLSKSSVSSAAFLVTALSGHMLRGS